MLQCDNVNYLPVPAREIAWVPVGELSVIVTTPVLAPVCVGVKTTLILQLVPGSTGAVQVLVWLKSPVMVTPDTCNIALPELFRVTVLGLLDVPTVCGPNASLGGKGEANEVLRKTETMLANASAATRSGLPSPLKSATATASVSAPDKNFVAWST